MDVVLLAPSLPETDNHAIAALRTALRAERLAEEFVPFRGFLAIERTVQEVLALEPRVVGVSLQTIESALATAVFTRLLRKRGFSGRTVVGGHFATLNAEALLRSPAGIDAVVQFAGEEALVAIARGILDDEGAAAKVPGLVFVGRDGALRKGAAPTWTSGTRAAMPRLDPLSEHLGFKVADLVSSRGCEAHCSYCCIAAASDLARESAEGHSAYERRSIASLAQEMVDLYEGHGARVFNFMDDNILPLDPEDVARWALDLRTRLDQQGVGRIALSMQLRADAVTEESARALAELGLCRAYVGVDGYSASQLRVLGRRSDPSAGPRALRRLWDQGIFAVVNALLVGPTIPFASVLSEVEALSRIEHAPVHLLPIEVRAGTSYFRAALRRGLVEGGVFHWHYGFVDERTQRMSEILTSFPTRLAERSVPIALYDFGYNLGIARRLLPELDVSRYVATYARTAEAWNGGQAALVRAAAVVAETRSRDAALAFVAEHTPRVSFEDRRLRDACDSALVELELLVSQAGRRRVHSHCRGKLLGAMAFSMSLAACGGASGDRSARTNPDDTDASATDTVQQSPGDTGTADASSNEGVSDADQRFDSSFSCPDGLGRRALLQRDDGTYETPEFCLSCDEAWTMVTFDTSGRAIGFAPAQGKPLSPLLEECLKEIFAEYCYPSLAGTTQRFGGAHCWIA